MLQSLIYVSRSQLIMPHDADQIAAIRLVSITRNRYLDLTGILIVTARYFAQYLEGESAPLAKVMASIRRDSRHTNLIVWDPPQLTKRRFPRWRMAFFGPDDHISRIADPILNYLNGTLPDRQRGEMILLIQNLSDQCNPRV